MTRRAIPRDLTGSTSSVALASSELVWDAVAGLLRVGNGATVGGLPIEPAQFSTTAQYGRAAKFYNVDGSGIAGMALPSGGGLIFRQPTSTATDVHSLRIERLAGYTSSPSSFENCAAAIYNIVGANAKAYETGLVVIMDNSAVNTGGLPQNSAVHLRALKKSSGSTWSIAMETQDETGLADPTTGLVGIENVIAGNGTDANRNRIGLDIIAARPTSGGTYSGATAYIGAGIRLVNQIADAATPNSFVTGILCQGYYSQDVIDTTDANITPGGVALRMGNGQLLSFTDNRDRTFDYAFGQLNYRVTNTPIWQIGDSGWFKSIPVSFADLDDPAVAGPGARSFVDDATATTFGTIVAGGGANKVPVYSDGTNWRIG
jgi:hypothetical protein